MQSSWLFLRLFLVFSLWTSGLSSAKSLQEEDFQQKYKAQVLPFLAKAESGILSSSDGRILSYQIFQNTQAKPSIVIIPGYSESWLMYTELIHDLYGMGYDLFIMDHRGMGFSGRLASNPMVAHVEKFSDYVDDAELFLKKVVQARAHGPIYLFAHSMGGLVSSYLLQRMPHIFRSVLLSAPLFQLNTGLIPTSVAYWLVTLQVFLGLGDQFVFGRAGFDLDKANPKACITTHSEARCSRQLRDYKDIPQTFMAGPSSLWVKEVLEASKNPRSLGEKVGKVPILLLQAEVDHFVRSTGQEVFCNHAENCRLQLIPGSFHEIFQEKDATRDGALAALKAHFR